MFTAIVKPVPVYSTNILEQKQGSIESSKMKTSPSDIEQKHRVKSADTSLTAKLNSGVINLSTNTKTNLTLHDKIGNTKQARLETMPVKPRTTEATSLQTSNNESFARNAKLSGTFVKSFDIADNANQDHLAEKLDKEEDPVFATTKQSIQQQVMNEVGTVVICIG